jgi:hypothetical protein
MRLLTAEEITEVAGGTPESESGMVETSDGSWWSTDDGGIVTWGDVNTYNNP